jgi:hypothetical protein
MAIDLRPEGAAMKKMVKVLVLAAILSVTLAVSPAQACACGGVPDWPKMSVEEIVSTVNQLDDKARIEAARSGNLPPPPDGYRYLSDYTLAPLSR